MNSYNLVNENFETSMTEGVREELKYNLYIVLLYIRNI